MIKKLLKYKPGAQNRWPYELSWACDTVNNTPSIYGYSPRQLAFGTTTKPIETEYTKYIMENVPQPLPLEYNLHLEQISMRLHQLDEVKKTRTTNNKKRDIIRNQAIQALKDKDVNIQFCKNE